MKTYEKVSHDKDFIYEKNYLHLYAHLDNVINIIEEEEDKILLPFCHGKTLFQLPFNARYKTFLKLVNDFPYKEKENYTFNTLNQWIMNTYLKDHSSKIKAHLEFCLKAYEKFSTNYPENKVIHGDLHFHNIILEDKPIIIDPKGVLANPIYEYSRMLLNEIWTDPNNQEEIINIFTSQINYPKMDILFCLYLDTCLSLSWMDEDGLFNPVSFKLMENLKKRYFQKN